LLVAKLLAATSASQVLKGRLSSSCCCVVCSGKPWQ